VVLRLAEITLIEALTSEQVIVEAERNLSAKLAQALPAFQLIVSRCLRVVPDPQPADLGPTVGLADPKDLPILVAALREGCRWLAMGCCAEGLRARGQASRPATGRRPHGRPRSPGLTERAGEALSDRGRREHAGQEPV